MGQPSPAVLLIPGFILSIPHLLAAPWLVRTALWLHAWVYMATSAVWPSILNAFRQSVGVLQEALAAMPASPPPLPPPSRPPTPAPLHLLAAWEAVRLQQLASSLADAFHLLPASATAMPRRDPLPAIPAVVLALDQLLQRLQDQDSVGTVVEDAASLSMCLTSLHAAALSIRDIHAARRAQERPGHRVNLQGHGLALVRQRLLGFATELYALALPLKYSTPEEWAWGFLQEAPQPVSAPRGMVPFTDHVYMSSPYAKVLVPPDSRPLGRGIDEYLQSLGVDVPEENEEEEGDPPRDYDMPISHWRAAGLGSGTSHGAPPPLPLPPYYQRMLDGARGAPSGSQGGPPGGNTSREGDPTVIGGRCGVAPGDEGAPRLAQPSSGSGQPSPEVEYWRLRWIASEERVLALCQTVRELNQVITGLERELVTWARRTQWLQRELVAYRGEPRVGGRCGVIPRGDDPPPPRPTRGRGQPTDVASDSLHSLGGGGDSRSSGGERLFTGSEETADAPGDEASADDRLARLEALLAQQQLTITQQQSSLEQLMTLASRVLLERGPPVRDEEASHPVEDTLLGGLEGSNLTPEEGKATDPSKALPASQEVAVLQLRQEKRKEHARRLKQLLPWCQSVLVTQERALLIQSVVPRLYGPAAYTTGGTPQAADDVISVFQRFALPPVLTAQATPRFLFNPTIVLGAILHRWGGSGRRDDTYTCRVSDFKPIREGQDKQLASTSVMMVTNPPTEQQRALPRTMAEFLEAALAMAYMMGLFVGPRVEHELHISIRTLYERGMRAPSLMPVAVACHLLDQLISMVLEAIYTLASGRSPMDVGTDVPTPSEVQAYVVRGWISSDEPLMGPSFIIRPNSPYLQLWYEEPLKAASLSTGRFATALEFMGLERGTRPPPQGGPTGAPSAPEGLPSVVSYRANGTPYIQRAVYQEAELALGRQATDAPLCFRFLSHSGCTRTRCPLSHEPLSLAFLRVKCQASPLLRAIFEHHGGARGQDAAQPPGKAGATTPLPGAEASDGSSEEEEELPARGGWSSGCVEVQVPYLAYVPHCYPQAPLSDARATLLAAEVSRPSTVHPDAPAQPYFPHSLMALSPPSMTRLAGSLFHVTQPDSGGSFVTTLGPFTFRGQDLGQSFDYEGKPVVNACVTLTWASVLKVSPQSLFRQLLQLAYDADRSLGPPPPTAPPTTVLVRAMVHDVAASAQVGHALDSLLVLYLTPVELARRVVVLIHYSGEDVAVDIIRGVAAGPTAPISFCLQLRGTPGHMTPLFPAHPTSMASLQEWLDASSIPVRSLTAVGWRQLIGEDLSGPSSLWSEHSQCDFCRGPRFPLPSAPSL